MEILEEWRNVWLHNNLMPYEVSCFGRVRNSKTKKLLKPSKGHGGYYRVNISYYGHSFTQYVHRLVGNAFLPKPHGSEIHHKDSNKRNNTVWNLEFISHKLNTQHREDRIKLNKTV